MKNTKLALRNAALTISARAQWMAPAPPVKLIGSQGTFYKDKKSNNWYISCSINGKRIRKSLRTENIDEAKERAAELKKTDFRETNKDQKYDNKDVELWAHYGKGLKSMFDSAKDRAKKASLEFNITFLDLCNLYEKSRGVCALTGIPFSMEELHNVRRRPFIPSLDRMNNTVGYTKKNCRLVLCAVNIAINEFGEELFFIIAHHYVHNKKGRKKAEKQ